MIHYTTGRVFCAALAALTLAIAGAALATPQADAGEAAAHSHRRASAPVLAPNAPTRYVVKKGDTLWHIAAAFLRSPWRWPSIYAGNPEIKNPNLIYPGDILVLAYINGRPEIRLERRGSLPVEHLAPHVRTRRLAKAIPTIPISAVRPFLSHSLVLDADYLKHSGYLLRPMDGRLLAAAHERVYARDLKRSRGRHYSLVEKGPAYTDPENGALLGYAALYIGTGRVTRWGDPDIVLLSQTTQEARAGNRFIPVAAGEFDSNFTPHPPAKQIKGQIIAAMGGISRQRGYASQPGDTYGLTPIGQYQVVVLDRGRADGLEVGDVLGIYRKGKTVNDQYAGGHFGSDFVDGPSIGSFLSSEDVRLPDTRAGELLVFRTFKRVSFGLVMRAEHEAHVFDLVENP